jgi:hypothetical protein
MEQANEILLEQLGDVTLFDIKGDVTALSEPFLNDAYEKANGQVIKTHTSTVAALRYSSRFWPKRKRITNKSG